LQAAVQETEKPALVERRKSRLETKTSVILDLRALSSAKKPLRSKHYERGLCGGERFERRESLGTSLGREPEN